MATILSKMGHCLGGIFTSHVRPGLPSTWGRERERDGSDEGEPWSPIPVKKTGFFSVSRRLFAVCFGRLQSRSCNDKCRRPEGGEPAISQARKPPSQLARGIDMRWIAQWMRFPRSTTHEIGGGDRINK